jgi:hypothetical protein
MQGSAHFQWSCLWNLFGMGQNTLKEAKKAIRCQINLKFYVKMSMFGNQKVIEL